MNLRIAVSGDASGIFAVLTEVAPEIPLLLDTQERRAAAVSAIVTKCISSGESWVALNDSDSVAGFLLVEPDDMERFQRNNHALHLRYAGVARIQRGAASFVR